MAWWRFRLHYRVQLAFVLSPLAFFNTFVNMEMSQGTQGWTSQTPAAAHREGIAGGFTALLAAPHTHPPKGRHF